MFKNFIMENFPFLENDFDALTDYELFCKMMEYVKQFAEDNEEFKIKLNDLQEQIDNIDVTDAVNNKLNQMVQDGTLENLINQELFGDLNDKINNAESDIDDLIEFNNYTNKPLKYGKLNLPSEFSHYNFELYRNYDGTIYDNLDFSSYDTVNKLYVDRENGNDSTGTGASDAPFKTIKAALTAITDLSGTNWKVICKTYRFFRNEFYNETQANEQYDMYKNIIIEPYDSNKQIIVTTAQETLSWTSDGNGVYHATRSGVFEVYDMSEKDVFGCFKIVPKVETLTDCQNISNTYYISGSTIYVHTKTGSQPTNDTYIINLSLSTCTFNIRNNLFLRLKNIDFYVSSPLKFYNLSTNYENTLICENVKIFGAGAENGFTINNVKNCYIIDCVTGNNKRDGFNYHFTTMPTETIANTIIYEKNCKSYNNGLNDTNYTNNCSTIHEGANIIRANNVYQNSQGPIVADINSSHSMLLNCKITQELSGSQYYKQIVFQDDTNEHGTAYLIDCSSVGTNNLSLDGTDNFDIKLKNFKGNYKNSNLDISLYNE